MSARRSRGRRRYAVLHRRRRAARCFRDQPHGVLRPAPDRGCRRRAGAGHPYGRDHGRGPLSRPDRAMAAFQGHKGARPFSGPGPVGHLPDGRRYVRDGRPACLVRRLVQNLCQATQPALALPPDAGPAPAPKRDAEHPRIDRCNTEKPPRNRVDQAGPALAGRHAAYRHCRLARRNRRDGRRARRPGRAEPAIPAPDIRARDRPWHGRVETACHAGGGPSGGRARTGVRRPDIRAACRRFRRCRGGRPAIRPCAACRCGAGGCRPPIDPARQCMATLPAAGRHLCRGAPGLPGVSSAAACSAISRS